MAKSTFVDGGFRPLLQQRHVVVGVTTVSLRADILNVFDDPLFSGPVTTYGTTHFGQITTVNGFARAVQFQARIGW